MNRMARATVLLCLGANTISLIWTGGFGWFVQQRMRWPLLAAGIILLALGSVEALAAARAERADPGSVLRSAGPVVGWLLILPLLVLLAVSPTGLGAAAADRVDAYTPNESASLFPPIPASAEPAPIRLYDFLDRAVWDPGRSLDGVEVVLEGLVVNDPEIPGGFRLTRFMVSCCAADGIPLQVAVLGAGEAYANDSWVQVVARWRPPPVPYEELERPWLVEAEAIEVTVLPEAPADPYESPY